MVDTTNDQEPSSSLPAKGLGQRWEYGKTLSSWPILKLAHAAQCKAELESRISLWSAGRPIDTDYSLSEDRRRWQTRLRVRSAPPSQEWSLILGDMLYSLRSALDACVWEFAHIDGASPPKPKLVQFPVVRDRADWNKALRERLQSVPQEIAERIEMLQPFNRPPEQVDADPLICLTDLNNLDKHRASIEVSIDPHNIQQNVSTSWASEEAAERNAPPNITYHFPDLVDQALVVDTKFNDPVKEIKGGFSIGLQVTVATPIGKLAIGSLTNGLMQNIQQVLNFIAIGPATPEEVQAMSSQDDEGWLPLNVQSDGSGRTFYTGTPGETDTPTENL
ncbi:hypothetical protein [Streptomyces griseoluteus]|uniref:hypothetical protein n=1 Tax=Streptomyces griseoluteus TaxID=29306 RepID=UPI0038269D82